MINPTQRNILHDVLNQCINITNETDYYCWFSYIPHCNAYSVHIKNKGDEGTDNYLLHECVISLEDEAWREEERKRVSDSLDEFLESHKGVSV